MKMYSLYLQEPLLNAFRALSEKTEASVSELMRVAMREFIGRCLERKLLTEEQVKDIYFQPTNKPEDVTYPTFSE